MSILLLTTLPDVTLQSVKLRDPTAQQLSKTNRTILSTQSAICCEETMDTLFSDIPFHHPKNNKNVSRCEYPVKDGWVLRIVHSTGVMGPSKFINIGVGAYTAPWGVWTLFKVNDEGLTTLTLEEAHEGYEIARQYTYHYTEHNTRMAHMLGYI